MIRILAITFIILLPLYSLAQDQDFSQYLVGGANNNPGLTAIHGNNRITSISRLQWPGLSGSYFTSLLNSEFSFNKGKSGAGLYYKYDMAGTVINTQSLALNFAHDIQINKNTFIRPGLLIGFERRHVDMSHLVFGDQIERRGFVYNSSPDRITESTRYYPDFSAGFVLHSSKLFFGFSAMHLNRPDQGTFGVSRLPIRYSVISGYSIFIGDSMDGVSITPNIAIHRQQDFRMLLPGVNFRFGRINSGISYRIDDAIVITAGMRFNKLRFGYAYDYTISKLKGSGGSHELMLAYTFNSNIKDQESLRNPAF